MTVREWKNILWGVFTLTLYASLINLLGLRGNFFYGSVVLGVGLCIMFGHRIRHSRDNNIVVDYIIKFKEKTYDIFSSDNYVLARETSSEKITDISSIVLENYGKDEIQEMLKFVEDWKEVNNFKWGNTTVYDTLVIEGIVDDKFKTLKYNIKHHKNTKFFKIKGKLEKKTFVLGKDKAPEGNKNMLYTIKGLDFCLTNVYPKDLGASATWGISIDNSKAGRNGIIVNRENWNKEV